MYKKYFLVGLICFIINLYNESLYSNENILIKFVQQREQDFVNLQNNIKSLWNKHIKYKFSSDGIVSCEEIFFKGSYTDALRLYEDRQKMKTFEYDTNQEIIKILESGFPINSSDSQGKTALHYCKSRSVYNFLRNNGADFKLTPFLYVNRWCIGSSLIILGGLISWLYYKGYLFHKNNKQSKEIDLSLNSCDENGRTLIMNYLIEQEKLLQDLHEKASLLVNGCCVVKLDRDRQVSDFIFEINNTGNYFVNLKNLNECRKKNDEQLSNYLNKYWEIHDNTIEMLTSMINQGAHLDIKDNEGKVILDYCKTKTFYILLRYAGATYKTEKIFLGIMTAAISLTALAAFKDLYKDLFTIKDTVITRRFDDWVENQKISRANPGYSLWLNNYFNY